MIHGLMTRSTNLLNRPSHPVSGTEYWISGRHKRWQLKQVGQSSRQINYLRDHTAKYRSRLYRILAISYFVQTEGPALNSLQERRNSRYNHAYSTHSTFFSYGTTSKASYIRAENLSMSLTWDYLPTVLCHICSSLPQKRDWLGVVVEN